MELTEACTEKAPQIRPPPGKQQCYRRYVQPPRVKSFAPEKHYRPSSKPLDVKTTYHVSYLNVDNEAARCARTQPFRPTGNLRNAEEKFAGDTTTRLTFKPIWDVVKPSPIIPKKRSLMKLTGHATPMESITTARHDFMAKHIDRPQPIVPCGQIRRSSAILDGRTTAKLSYVNPGKAEPVVSFKPSIKYSPPDLPLPSETTHKLSYRCNTLPEREIYPWSLKPTYKPPKCVMSSETTYSKSFLEKEEAAVKRSPFLPPPGTDVLPREGDFAGQSIYKEAFLPCTAEPVTVVIPRGNITLPDEKLLTETTNKMSYRPVYGEKRAPIKPRSRSTLPTGSMQCETTNRHDFPVKTATSRVEKIIPSDNIRIAEEVFNALTTTASSYKDPGTSNIERVSNFKPTVQYNKPVVKIDSETINKLSFQPWAPLPKEELPWAQKTVYRPPENSMAADTLYKMSYPPPGHFIEEDPSCLPE